MRSQLLVTAVALLAMPLVCVADEAAKTEPAVTDEDRQHWAFQPLHHPDAPQLGDTDWPENPIDHFVLRKLRDAGLEPTLPADRRTLIRRVTFDLTGLPPTPKETAAFVADNRPDAYDRLLDRLLSSQAYGERWAQHWLDLARFAETDGFEHDKVRKNAWRYRDWVIRALNDDMPYSEFVQQQIAGDLLYPEDPDAAIATGFALCGPDMVDINLVAERKHLVLNDITGTVGSVFLGMQLGCAECHDHKYDPISQADFYRLRAFFEPSLHYKPNGYETKGKKAAPLPTPPHKGRILYDAADQPPEESYLWVRGDFRSRGPQVEPGFPRIAMEETDEAIPAGKSRAVLADWLASPDNYLASRVIVNRLWQHHFGYGLVRSPSDFGLMGEEPTHPELLDWLADELYRRGGSFKAMHKLMLTSATYCQGSRLTSQSAEVCANWKKASQADPDNRLLWRANRQRLEGEAIRDAMLAAANQLSARKGGRGVMPPLPQELVVTLLKNQWKVTKDEEDHRRRSIYLFVRRNLRYPIFEVFDRPDTNASCPRRSQSTIAPQALVLLNSEFSLQQAQQLAQDVASQADRSPESRIDLLYRRTLSRPPSDEEIARASRFLDQRAADSRKSGGGAAYKTAASTIKKIDQHDLAALTYLSLAAYNLNEFVYVD